MSPSKRREAEGVSVYRLLKDAQKKAQKYPDNGEHIAVLQVRQGQGITFAKTGRRRESHYTRWGEPGVLLDCVIDVMPVTGAMEQ